MGVKHSSTLHYLSQNEGTESSIPNPIRNNNFYTDQDPSNNFNRQNQSARYPSVSRRQNMVYNFSCLPPKPPRQNADILMTGGAASNRLASNARMSPVINQENYSSSYRKHDMATIVRTDSMPTKQSMLQELLECAICMNLYDNPHVLPCQHTFCKQCIVSLHNNSATSRANTIDCPICREKHTLKNGVESLSANYTMKRLIELEAMNVAEKERSKDKLKEKSKAKCFGCQKYSLLSICGDCSYMLCYECIENPDHDIFIESKINSKKQYGSVRSGHNSTRNRYANTSDIDNRRHGVYSSQRGESTSKLKLILLCHSSAVEAANEGQQHSTIDGSEVFEDEYGKCTTFHKIGISINDRVITLKKIVEKRFGVLTKDQILVYKDKVLKSDLKLLNHYNLRQFSRIHIFDERDLKEDEPDLEEDLYGVYQDANSIQANETKDQPAQIEATETFKKQILHKVNNMSSSFSSQTDSNYEENRKYRTVGGFNETESEFKPARHYETRRSSPELKSTRSNNYKKIQNNKYSTASRYRRLDEIFDRQINLNDY